MILWHCLADWCYSTSGNAHPLKDWNKSFCFCAVNICHSMIAVKLYNMQIFVLLEEYWNWTFTKLLFTMVSYFGLWSSLYQLLIFTVSGLFFSTRNWSLLPYHVFHFYCFLLLHLFSRDILCCISLFNDSAGTAVL